MSLQVTQKEEERREVVLTRPLPIDGDYGVDHKSPNLLQRIFSLLKNIQLGADLTHLQVPVVFNIPKSNLQIFGEPVYAAKEDLLQKCNRADNPVERMISVVAWSISTTRPIKFGVSPYNSILGETHHVSSGNLNVLLEQISHHPAVSALHATNQKENIDLVWCIHPVAKFYGSSVEAEILGKKQLKLMNHGETYLMNSPRFFIRFIGACVDWIGKVKIHCQETGLGAELCYSTNSLIGRRGQHCVKGKIFNTSSSPASTLYEVNGHWNSTVTIKDMATRKETIIYDAKQLLTGIRAAVVKDPSAVQASESSAVWSKVSKEILSENWEKANEEKKCIEEKQREIAKQRNGRGETWNPKHFAVSFSKETGWDCSPIQQLVPPAPIVYPL